MGVARHFGQLVSISATSRLVRYCPRPMRAATSARKRGRLSLRTNWGLLSRLDETLDALAEKQSKHLVAAHERFSSLLDNAALPSSLPCPAHGSDGDIHPAAGEPGVNFPSIRIEGAILSPDILEQIEELPGQRPSDFGLDAGIKVKDEIARAWADAQDYWRIFQRKLETLKEGNNATTETRNLWMVPLLGLLRYDIEYQSCGIELNGRNYPISHRATNRANTSVQIIGARDPAGLDKKPVNATRRMSAHALVQEFLNLHEQLYGLVTDGHVLRLLRDSSRLVKLSYLEFDLERIFTDGLFADFAVLFRLLHATRLPLTNETAAESLIERYHQNSLDSGARIREGLSEAVEQAIRDFGNGFLSHPDNGTLRAAADSGAMSADEFYQQLLRLVYRLLFLMVIEERDLVFPSRHTEGAARDLLQVLQRHPLTPSL